VIDDGLGHLYTINNDDRGSSFYGYPYESTNEGITWQIDTVSIGTLLNKGVTSIFFDGAGNEYTIHQAPVGYNQLLFKRPVGGKWGADTLGMNVGISSVGDVLASAYDGAGFVYATILYDKSTYRRPVAGTVWSLDTTGLGVKQMALLYRGVSGDMYGSDYQTGGFYRRHNDIWASVALPPTVPPLSPVVALSVDSGGALYAAFYNKTIGGVHKVFYTTDQGANWTNAGLDSVTVNQLVSYGDTTYVLTNGRGVIMLVRSTPPAYKCGDADGSSSINVSDVVFLINYIFASGPAPNPFAAGDPDCSGTVNITDGVYLINYIFASGPLPCAACK
jgi:hypothetical protein